MYMYIQSSLPENLLLTMHRKWEGAKLPSWLGVKKLSEIKFQVSFPGIKALHCNTLSFLTLITELQGHSARSGHSVLSAKYSGPGLHYWLTIGQLCLICFSSPTSFTNEKTLWKLLNWACIVNCTMISYCIVVTQAKHFSEFRMYLKARCPIARATFIKSLNLAYTVCKLAKSIFLCN